MLSGPVQKKRDPAMPHSMWPCKNFHKLYLISPASSKTSQDHRKVSHHKYSDLGELRSLLPCGNMLRLFQTGPVLDAINPLHCYCECLRAPCAELLDNNQQRHKLHDGIAQCAIHLNIILLLFLSLKELLRRLPAAGSLAF